MRLAAIFAVTALVLSAGSAWACGMKNQTASIDTVASATGSSGNPATPVRLPEGGKQGG